MRRIRHSLFAVLVLPAATACSSASAAPATPSPGGSSPDGLTRAQMDSIYNARIEAGRTRYTDADVRFMTGMIHHHAQAIEMARLAPERSESSSIQILAARIINAQNDEIATMQRWLRNRDRPVPELHITDDAVMVHGGGEHSHMDMPGMVTRAQMDELKAARGLAFDRLFLTRMIDHHRGAVTMVRELFATDGAAQDEDSFRFASDVQVDQATEVQRMEQMLEALPDRR